MVKLVFLRLFFLSSCLFINKISTYTDVATVSDCFDCV